MSTTSLIIVEAPKRPFKRTLKSKPMKIALRAKTGLKRKIKPKKVSISKLVKKLDTLVSKHVRNTNAVDGICTCYTCGHKAPISKMQCGHYISRYSKILRWDLRNLRVQCPMCNIWKRGDIPTYRENLVKELGEAEVLQMEASRKELIKLDPMLLEVQIEYYERLAAKL